MTTFVSGATGMIGANIVQQLMERGENVRALVRNEQRGRDLLPEGCELAKGDITEPDTLRAAMDGCDVVYHAAGLPEQWFKDPKIFTRVNVEGTRNMLEAARQAKVRRFIYTSTIDVFQAGPGQVYDESVIDPEPKGTFYERSKQAADRLAVDYLHKGMDIVFLHPSGLYGPGPAGSPGSNGLIADLIKGKVPMLLPGGFPVVYSVDCARGHILAADKAKAGDRFILSEGYYDLVSFTQTVASIARVPRIPRVMPLWFARLFAAVGELAANITGKPPLLPKGQLHFLQWRAIPNADKARRVLSWETRSLSEGIKATIAFLQSENVLPNDPKLWQD